MPFNGLKVLNSNLNDIDLPYDEELVNLNYLSVFLNKHAFGEYFN